VALGLFFGATSAFDGAVNCPPLPPRLSIAPTRSDARTLIAPALIAPASSLAALSLGALIVAMSLAAPLAHAAPVTGRFGHQARDPGKVVAGMRFPGALRPGVRKIWMVGAGLRTKWVFKVYALAVYQRTVRGNARHVIRANEEKFIWLRMLRAVSASDLAEAVHEGLRDNIPAPIRKQIAPQVARFVKALPTTIPKGADIGFWYRPGTGMRIQVAHGPQLRLHGYDAMVAIWSIWFGRKPSDADLKAEVLEQPRK